VFNNDHNDLFQRIRQGDYTGEIVVDPDTPLEHFFSLPLYAGALCLVLGGLWYFFSGQAAAWSMLKYGLILLPIGGLLSSQVEVNYRIDLEAGTVSLYRRIFRWEHKSHVCNLDQVDCVADDTSVTFRDNGSRRRREYRSGLVLVLKNATILRVIGVDFKDHGAVAEHGERLADLLSVPYRSGGGKVQVRRTANGPQVSHKPPPTLSTWDMLTGGCCGVLLVAGLTFGLIDRAVNGPRPTRREHHGRTFQAPLKRTGVDLVPDLASPPVPLKKGKGYHIGIMNMGTQPCKTPFLVTVDVDGKRIYTDKVVKPLKPAIGKMLLIPLTKGKLMKVTVDAKNAVQETDKTNNVATLTLDL
jgi:hypothetical protein